MRTARLCVFYFSCHSSPSPHHPASSSSTFSSTPPTSIPYGAPSGGDWKLANGALKGIENAPDKLPALISRPAAFQDAVIQTRVKLDGVIIASILIEDANGHLCRVLVGPKGIRIVKDGNRKTNEKSILLAESRAPVDTGDGKILTVTIEGIRIQANLRNVTLSRRHPSISAPKTSVGLPVFGNSASFDWVRVSKLR